MFNAYDNYIFDKIFQLPVVTRLIFDATSSAD